MNNLSYNELLKKYNISSKKLEKAKKELIDDIDDDFANEKEKLYFIALQELQKEMNNPKLWIRVITVNSEPIFVFGAVSQLKVKQANITNKFAKLAKDLIINN